MARKPTTTAPVEATTTDDEGSLYTHIMEVIRSDKATKDFAGQHAKEAVQSFLKRVAETISDLSETAYADLSTAALDWYEKAADRVKTGDMPLLEGMPAVGAKAPVAKEEAPAPKAPAAKKDAKVEAPIEEPKTPTPAAKKGSPRTPEEIQAQKDAARARIMEINKKRAAARAEPAASAGVKVTVPEAKAASKAVEKMKGSEKAAKAAKEPKVKTPKEPKVKTPKEPKVKTPKEPKVRAEGVVSIMRRAIVHDPAVTDAALIEMVTKRGLVAKPATISAVRTDTMATLKVLEELKLFVR